MARTLLKNAMASLPSPPPFALELKTGTILPPRTMASRSKATRSMALRTSEFSCSRIEDMEAFEETPAKTCAINTTMTASTVMATKISSRVNAWKFIAHAVRGRGGDVIRRPWRGEVSTARGD